MTRQEVGQLCCKVLGIYTLVAGIAVSEGAFLSLAVVRQGGILARITTFLPAFLLLSFSGYLWLYAEPIAARMFSNEAPAEHASGVTPEILRRIAFVFAGILIVNSALTDLAQVIASLLTPQMTVHSAVYLGDAIVRLVLGFWLIFGSQRLRSWFGAKTLQNLTKKDW